MDMRNVLLLCMSKIDETKIKENQYIYTLSNGKREDKIWGFTTNEAPVKYIIKDINSRKKEESDKLDRIIIICSDEVKNRWIKFGECNNDKEKEKKRDSFKEKMEKLFPGKCEIKLTEYYKKIVELETKKYNYEPEYIEIPISDNPEDTEVAKAVIEAVKNVMEFSDEGINKGENQKNDIHLYIDYNGGPRYVAFMQVILAQFLKTRHVELEQIVTMNFDNKEDEKIPIQNLLPIFDSTNLIGKVNEYINYGRIEGLKEYFKNACSNEIDKLLEQMEKFSNNLQLCRTGYIMSHAQELSEQLDEFVQGMKKEEQGEKKENQEDDKKKNTYEQLFTYVIEDIQKEFQLLLTGKLPDIIKWCVDKGYIQQALTFCSEQLPQYLWNEGIFKAADEREYDNFLKVVRAVKDGQNEVIFNRRTVSIDDLKKEGNEDDFGDAVNRVSRYFPKGCEDKESNSYAYHWFVNYLQQLDKEDYKEILQAIEKVAVSDEEENCKKKEKQKSKEDLKKEFKKVKYLNEFMIYKKRYKVARNKVAPRMAIIFWNYQKGRIQSEIDYDVLKEIIFTYFILKGQRNATNHADGQNDGFEYSEICKILNHLVELLNKSKEV